MIKVYDPVAVHFNPEKAMGLLELVLSYRPEHYGVRFRACIGGRSSYSDQCFPIKDAYRRRLNE